MIRTALVAGPFPYSDVFQALWGCASFTADGLGRKFLVDFIERQAGANALWCSMVSNKCQSASSTDFAIRVLQVPRCSRVRFAVIVSLSWWSFSYRAGTRGSDRRREFQYAPVMLCKCLVHTPFAMPYSRLTLVVCDLPLLRERRDFADFCDTVKSSPPAIPRDSDLYRALLLCFISRC